MPSTPVLWFDSLSAAALASNLVFQARLKHIELDVHFVRDQILSKKLDVRYLPTLDQTADCLTKALAHTRFQLLRDKLGVSLPPPSSLKGSVKAVTISDNIQHCKSISVT